jgi:heterodisulfide reductase subunit A
MTEKKQAALVVGGGVAGMQAALDIANQGFKVYLVEKTPSIGGRMAQLDKTFPTLDCSACILTPKLSEVAHHKNINLMTYSEVGSVTGKSGDFHVRIRRKARFVRDELCSGCGDCAAECPVEVPNEFDMNLGFRKAIYIGFPQATPNVYAVDKDNCIDCGRCVKVCQRNAIDLAMEDKNIDLHVGTIIVATGFELFDVSQYPRLGYGHYANVIHAMEFERLINAAGPTSGHLVRLSDGKKPNSIGFIQCVGARDVQKGVPYCSRVCCMYSIKNAVMTLEHYPNAEVWVYYADIRAFGKGFEEFYEMAKHRFGVKFIRGRVAEVMEGKDTGNLVVKVEDTESSKVRLIEHDMVVISPGVIPSEGMDTLATKMGIERTDDGYIQINGSFSGPILTKTPGVFVCGCADGPKDIPDSVSAGSAAAMKATIILSKGGI